MAKKKHDDGLSKKERKTLKAREEQLAAELAERKAEKKARKAAKRETPASEPIDATEQGVAAEDPEPELATRDDDTTAEIKKRVEAKRRARAEKALEALDRDDDDAVRLFNETHGKVLGRYATSTRESEEQLAKMDRAEQRVAAVGEPVAVRVAEGDENLAGPLYMKMAESVAAKVDKALMEERRPLKRFQAQTAEEVDTDRGRVFEVGTAESDAATAASSQPDAAESRGFALPSEGKGDFETNGLGQYKVKRPSDGKLVGYTRVTTFIDAIDDKSTLTDWKMRILLEGIVANEDHVLAGDATLMLSKVRDLVHRRDVDLAKARKKDRKGKLEVGQLAEIEESTYREYRNAMKVVVEELLELGGAHEKANKGTDLHRLGQLYFETGGLDAVGAELTAGTITPSDLADIEALDRAVQASGFRWERSEVMVVNDEAKIAGRLDGIGMVRLPGSKRATRVVFDIKTGRIDMGTKIPMQLANYAGMRGYDPAEPDEREDLKINATKALLIHLPAGKAECHMYVVDLPTGRVGNRLATEVRSFRTAGKKGIDTSVDLATGIALEAPEEES